MTTETKTEIALCLGSACFARGNNQTRKIIEDYLKINGLWGKVAFHGGRCYDHCQQGPVLKINDRIIERVNEQNIIEILDSIFNL